VLLFHPDDRDLPEYFIRNSRPSIDKYDRVMDALKQEPLSEFNLMRRTNLRPNQVRVIKADLIDQGIIREVMYGRSKKYEYQFNAPDLDTRPFEKLREFKFGELENMLEYIYTTENRMAFLCNYLGDASVKGENRGTGKLQQAALSEEWKRKIEEFRGQYFPELPVESKTSNMVNGVAAAYYGFTNVGSVIHRCKYENGGDFPDHLLKQTLRAFRRRYGNERFDMVVYIPPTESGDLVKNFAEKIARILGFPIYHDLKKIFRTKPQKVFQNSVLKRDNVKGAFRYEGEAEVNGKKVLLIDDIFDSGATMRETGRLLTKLGAEKIAPLVIAKTVGGDL
jgi:ATP-dependent DNA helicase RecQ